MATRIALRVALIMVLSHHHCIFVIFCQGGRNVDLTHHHMHVTPFLMMVQKVPPLLIAPRYIRGRYNVVTNTYIDFTTCFKISLNLPN